MLRQKSFDADEQSIKYLQERERRLKKLEKPGMADLQSIIVLLEVKALGARDIINKMESIVEMTEDNVQEGFINLGEAQRYKNKSRRKKLCLYLICVIILLILIIIIVLVVLKDTIFPKK